MPKAHVFASYLYSTASCQRNYESWKQPVKVYVSKTIWKKHIQEVWNLGFL